VLSPLVVLSTVYAMARAWDGPWGRWGAVSGAGSLKLVSRPAPAVTGIVALEAVPDGTLPLQRH